jgi:hypothetical protein
LARAAAAKSLADKTEPEAPPASEPPPHPETAPQSNPTNAGWSNARSPGSAAADDYRKILKT